MDTFEFQALGTHWALSVDGQQFSDHLKQEIISQTADYEEHFSRFKMTSEVNAFREACAGEYPISKRFCQLLIAADTLRELTQGRFDPAVARLLEQVGYDAQYNFSKAPDNFTIPWVLTGWNISNDRLQISGPIAFDLGGIGKGYWIDQLSVLLKRHGYKYHMVEGGGDMMATRKADGSGWRAALQWPGKEDTAIGIVELKNQALAVSDVYKRKWKNWHHLIDAREAKPIQEIMSVMAIAPSAFLADQMTSALAFSSFQEASTIATHFQAKYLIITADQRLHLSPDWPGELF